MRWATWWPRTRANTPLIVTAGQQAREMVLCEPYLTNRDETLMPLPWVKWAYQPARAEDVPAAFMRAYAVALQPPAGPVFLSIPLDDWNKPALGPAVIRTVSHRVAPDEARLFDFAERLNKAKRPMLVFGPEVDRSGGWDVGVAFAEKVRAEVYGAPLPDRVSFPENHPLYRGELPMTIAGANEVMRGHDLVMVIGAQVFRYYPYVAGDYLPEGTELLQITSDPGLAGAAPVGESILGDSRLALEKLLDAVNDAPDRAAPAPLARKHSLPDIPSSPLTPPEVYAALSAVWPADSRWSPNRRRQWPNSRSGCPRFGRVPSTRLPAAALVGACPLRSVSRWETAPVGSSARWSPPSATDRSNTRCRRYGRPPNMICRSCSS